MLFDVLPQQHLRVTEARPAEVFDDVFQDGGRLTSRIRVVVDQLDDALDHIFLAPVSLSVSGVGILFAEVVVDPYLDLALFINADHVLLYFEKASLMVYGMEAFEGRIQNIEVVWVGDILDLRKLDWDAFGVEKGSVVSRTKFFAMIFDEMASIHHVLLL